MLLSPLAILLQPLHIASCHSSAHWLCFRRRRQSNRFIIILSSPARHIWRCGLDILHDLHSTCQSPTIVHRIPPRPHRRSIETRSGPAQRSFALDALPGVSLIHSVTSAYMRATSIEPYLGLPRATRHHLNRWRILYLASHWTI